MLLVNRQSVDTVGHNVQYCRGNTDFINFRTRSEHPFFSDEDSSFHERAHAFFYEKRVSLSALDQKFCQRGEISIGTQQMRQQFLRTRTLQRFDAELRVIAPSAPTV